MSKTSKVILSLLGAMAAGVTIGLLISPEKRADIRKKFCDTASDLANKVGDMISAERNKIVGEAGSITKQTEGLAGDAINESVG
jgi:hypothetical protein